MTEAKTTTRATKQEPLSIFQIIPKVREEVGVIRKDQQATGGARYSYRGTDSIINALAPVLNRYGVFTTVEDFDYVHEVTETASKRVLTTVTLRKRVRFYGPQGDFVESVVAGENSDYSDKATGGASTYAYRYALVQTFVLPTDEDDPDAKYVEKEPAARPAEAVATPSQSDELKAIQADLKAKSQAVTGDLKGSAYLGKIIEDNQEKFVSAQGEPLGFAQVWKDATGLKVLAGLVK
jgi:hypothetical protein